MSIERKKHIEKTFTERNFQAFWEMGHDGTMVGVVNMLMSKVFHGAMVHVNLGHKGLNLHKTNMDQTWPNTDPQLWSLELGKLWLNRSIILERCFPHRHRWKFINGPQHRASGIGLPPGPHCQHPVSPWHGCGTEFLCSLSFQGQANCVCFSQRNLGKKNKKTSIQEKPDTYWYNLIHIQYIYNHIQHIYIYMYVYIYCYILIHPDTYWYHWFWSNHWSSFPSLRWWRNHQVPLLQTSDVLYWGLLDGPLPVPDWGDIWMVFISIYSLSRADFYIYPPKKTVDLTFPCLIECKSTSKANLCRWATNLPFAMAYFMGLPWQVRKLRNCPLCHSRLDVTAMP